MKLGTLEWSDFQELTIHSPLQTMEAHVRNTSLHFFLTVITILRILQLTSFIITEQPTLCSIRQIDFLHFKLELPMEFPLQLTPTFQLNANQKNAQFIWLFMGVSNLSILFKQGSSNSLATML